MKKKRQAGIMVESVFGCFGFARRLIPDFLFSRPSGLCAAVILQFSLPGVILAGNVPGFGNSGEFSFDTREVTALSRTISPTFALDGRALDGMKHAAESGSAVLNIGGPAVPMVTGTFPALVTGSDEFQWLTLTGEGFAGDSRVILQVGSEFHSIPASRTEYLGPNRIRIFVNLTTASASWTARVVNPGGVSSAPLSFEVLPPEVSPVGGHAFGSVALGETAERVFVLRNNRAHVVTGGVSVAQPFSLAGGAGFSLGPGEEQSVTVRFTPLTAGRHAREVRFQFDNESFTRTVSGVGVTLAPATGTVAGTVRGSGPDGPEGLRGIEVSLFRMTGGQPAATGHATHTGATGIYLMENVPPGEYHLETGAALPGPARLPGRGFEPASATVRVLAGQTAEIDFLLEPKPIPSVVLPKEMPVVLVRGRGNVDPGYWNDVRNHLLAEGFTHVWDPSADDSVIDGTAAISRNAASLHQYILAQAAAYEFERGLPPPKVNIVAHSMGGLITRQMLSDNRNQPANRRLPMIGDVFMLSTPNAGAVLADMRVGIDFWDRSWPANRDLTTSHIRGDFSERVIWPLSGEQPRLRLFLAGGTTYGLSLIYSISSDLIFLSDPRDAINDGAVTLLSSKGEYYPPTGLRRRQAFPGADLAAIPPQEIELNHTRIKEHSVIQEWISGILSQIAPAAIPGMAPMGTMMIAEGAGEETGPEALAFRRIAGLRGVAATGDAAVETFHSDLNGNLSVMVSWQGPATGVRLLTPGGIELDGRAGPLPPGMAFQEVAEPGTAGGTALYRISDPDAGEWGVMVDATESLEDTVFTVQVSGESTAGLVPMSRRDRFHFGQEVVLRAALHDFESDSVQIMADLAVSAMIQGPDGEPMEAMLFDDGNNGDGAAGDGVHGVVLDGLSPGTYTVVYRATGTHPESEMPMQRIAEEIFTISEGGGFLHDNITDNRVDLDGNGIADLIRLDVPVTVAEPGEYVLAGALLDEERSVEIHASLTFRRGEAGTASVALHFDRRRLPQNEMPYGPFILGQLELFKVGDSSEWLDGFTGQYVINRTLHNDAARRIRLEGDLDFGGVMIGDEAERTFTIFNDGYQTLRVYQLELPPGFTSEFNGAIDPGLGETVTVTFAPTSEAAYGGVVLADSDSQAGHDQLSLSGNGVTPTVKLEIWLADKGVPVDRRGALDDASGDGIPNLVAYALNIDPLLGRKTEDARALPVVTASEVEGSNHLTIRYRENRLAMNMTISVEVSQTLTEGSWSPVEPLKTVQTGTDPLTGDPLMETTVDVNGLDKAFLRLRVDSW